jgi:hypothetical protein
MRLNTLPGLAVNLIGITPLTWAIRRLATRRARTRSSKNQAAPNNTITIEIHTDGAQCATSVIASVTLPAVKQLL